MIYFYPLNKEKTVKLSNFKVIEMENQYFCWTKQHLSWKGLSFCYLQHNISHHKNGKVEITVSEFYLFLDLTETLKKPGFFFCFCFCFVFVLFCFCFVFCLFVCLFVLFLLLCLSYTQDNTTLLTAEIVLVISYSNLFFKL